ncbi:MAG TPA: hypothetical protein VMH35_20610 [Streptosporangiaceae bacterium]|nr:hypothetical protein [Streptosporangiaceae bacterium]
MPVPGPRAEHDRCAAELAWLRMLAAEEAGMVLPAVFAQQLSQVMSAILAEAETTAQAVAASVPDRRRAVEATRFLSARLARMATAAQDAAAAAECGDVGALRRQLHRFETLTTAMWTVQAAFLPRMDGAGQRVTAG